MKNDAFSACHPLVNFTYFLSVLLLSMFLTQPVCLALSLLGGAVYHCRLKGTGAVRFQLRYLLPLLLLTMALNPLFSHEGATILLYLPNGNPLTLESIAYGASAAVLLAAAVSWFACCNEVLTSDKFIYLFGRAAPALSLLLSMTLRFVPHFHRQMKLVAQARAGLASPNKVRFRRVRAAMAAFSATVTWALESAIQTADSMKSRGYGLRGRTAFHNFRFTLRDGLCLALCLGLTGLVLAGKLLGALAFRYYPTVSGDLTAPAALIAQGAFALLCFFPTILNLCEDIKWNSLPSAT